MPFKESFIEARTRKILPSVNPVLAFAEISPGAPRPASQILYDLNDRRLVFQPIRSYNPKAMQSARLATMVKGYIKNIRGVTATQKYHGRRLHVHR